MTSLHFITVVYTLVVSSHESYSHAHCQNIHPFQAHLNASKNQLTDLPLGSSSYWTHSLETLLLDQNKITEISQNIAGMSSLTFLNLSTNMIASLPPTCYWKGSCLKSLDLSNNLLTKLTDETPYKAPFMKSSSIKRAKKQPQQESTSIVYELREFPITLWTSSLQCLLLQDNMIQSIPECLSSLNALSTLNISGSVYKIAHTGYRSSIILSTDQYCCIARIQFHLTMSHCENTTMVERITACDNYPARVIHVLHSYPL